MMFDRGEPVIQRLRFAKANALQGEAFEGACACRILKWAFDKSITARLESQYRSHLKSPATLLERVYGGTRFENSGDRRWHRRPVRSALPAAAGFRRPCL